MRIHDATIPYKEHTLNNGLRVVLSPHKVAPVVAMLVMYKVGSCNERPGKTGFAHLFEHMMFQGSENVPREMHFKYVESNGGVLNGFTSYDLTTYFELLPASKLPLGLWLESDRMRSFSGKLRQSACSGQRGAPPFCGQSALRASNGALPRNRLRQLRQSALHHWLDGRPRQRHPGRCAGILQNLLVIAAITTGGA